MLVLTVTVSSGCGRKQSVGGDCTGGSSQARTSSDAHFEDGEGSLLVQKKNQVTPSIQGDQVPFRPTFC